MNTLTEIHPDKLSLVSSILTWTGIQPDFVLTTDNAATLLSYCGGLASAATWACVDVGRWRRAELRRRYTVGSDEYNRQVGLLYNELSEHLPSISSPVSWRAYLNVGDSVPYADREEGYGPAVYIPGLTLPPDAFDSFVLAVKEGEHKAFLAQLYGQQSRRIAPTASSNGYGAHADDSDDVPYSASAPGVVADADEATMEYERETGYLDSQIDSELLEEVAYLLRYAKAYCKDPWADDEALFWETEFNRCAVAIDRVNALLA